MNEENVGLGVAKTAQESSRIPEDVKYFRILVYRNKNYKENEHQRGKAPTHTSTKSNSNINLNKEMCFTHHVAVKLSSAFVNFNPSYRKDPERKLPARNETSTLRFYHLSKVILTNMFDQKIKLDSGILFIVRDG